MNLILKYRDSDTWTPNTLVLFVVFSIFHLVLSVINLENIVWVVNWESAKLIAEGIPMYDQSGFVTLPNGHQHKLPPDHFPLYFYLIATSISVFGPSQLIARILTWLFVLLTIFVLYKIIQPQSEKEWLLVQILFFLDPQLIVTNYYGKFDQITMFFLLLALYFLIDNKPIRSGIIFGLGVMIKFFPIFGFLVGGAFLLRRNELRSLLEFGFSGVITVGSVFLYHYAVWGDKFTNVIIYQIDRQTPSLSLWYYIIPPEIMGSDLLLPQLLTMTLTGLMILVSRISESINYPFLATSVLTAAFLTVSRQYYATYAYFIFCPLIPMMFQWYKNHQWINFTWSIAAYIIFNIGATLCSNSCYPQILPFTTISWIGVILVFVGTVVYIPLYPYEFLKKKDS